MADGGWQMADGGWRMADGGWRMANAATERAAHVSWVPESGWPLPPHGWAAASGEEKFDLSERIVRFGDILNTEGPLVEIRSRLVFANQAVGVDGSSQRGRACARPDPAGQASGEWRENSSHVDVGGQPGFPGGRKSVAPSALPLSAMMRGPDGGKTA